MITEGARRRAHLGREALGEIGRVLAIDRLAEQALQHKANGLGPLVDVRVRIHGTLLRCVALAHKPAKVVHAPIGFEQIMHCGDALAGVDLTALPPESVLDRHRAYRDISELGVRRFVQIFNALVSPGGIVGQSDGRLWRTRACRRFSYLDRKSAPGRKR